MRASLERRTVAGKPRRRLRGASLTEFAIVAPIALLLVLALIQVGFLFVAKQMVNHAAFLGARHGAVHHGREAEIRKAVQKALLPFYQDATVANDNRRIAGAIASATLDLAQLWNLDVKRLNPTAAAFDEYGLTDQKTGTVYIPNDSLEYRSYFKGQKSGLSLRDANTLKVRVIYAYELKVPLMKTVFRSVMCGFGSGIAAFGNGPLWSGLASADDCLRYYLRGRVPIVAYATVQMQSPPHRN
ncbi:MAG: pilus assembly protein [Burkholderiaceae bacterium]|nr:pilus assembly protein [Burkholderiaceae bacterium]MCX8005124.1 pilus assembly protein [Burkholderiaceae bacterium]